MSQTLTLIRGLPGSGKSTLARSMGCAHFEADMYFINAQGDYCYDVSLIGDAHEWCYKQVETSLINGDSVVVSNTFVCRWEIQPYYTLARKYALEFQVVECSGNYGSIHGVDQTTMKKMKKRWQQWPKERL
ncbi:AAA family ATPase [Vibrio amylolyticus]|uniref:AAA family ATPase n=1 Tax=Vibrio amylolyticus TaxID=2847292 RepID=UPI00354D0667